MKPIRNKKLQKHKPSYADSKSKKENYATAIASGDRLLSESKYDEALEAYELSHTINPFESNIQ